MAVDVFGSCLTDFSLYFSFLLAAAQAIPPSGSTALIQTHSNFNSQTPVIQSAHCFFFPPSSFLNVYCRTQFNPQPRWKVENQSKHSSPVYSHTRALVASKVRVSVCFGPPVPCRPLRYQKNQFPVSSRQSWRWRKSAAPRATTRTTRPPTAFPKPPFTRQRVGSQFENRGEAEDKGAPEKDEGAAGVTGTH